MRTFYFYTTRNFGDRMNAWLWPRLIPELLAASDQDVLVGIGSLIKSDLAKVPGRKILFGTGSGYGPMPFPDDVRDWRIYCVRGPLTARLMGLPEQLAVVDAAWLIDLLPELRLADRGRAGTVFIPHWTTDLYANWRQPCDDAGIGYINPHDEGLSILSRIAGARLAIVESLHGAIIADYYRTPWIPVASGARVLDFKWLDFCQSLNLPFRQVGLPVTDLAEAALTRADAAGPVFLRYNREADPDAFERLPYGKAAPATLSYRLIRRAKSLATPVRASLFDALNSARGTRAWRSSFRNRSRELGRLLTEIAEQPSHLSEDAVRQEKLKQLAMRFDSLRADHGLTPLAANAVVMPEARS